MNLSAAVLAQIRQAQPPSPESLGQLATLDGRAAGRHSAAALHEQLSDDLLGLGALAPLVADAAVTDVLVNGTEGVWVDSGDGTRRVDVDLGDDAALRRLAVRLATLAGRRLDDASPCVDGLLPGGVRLHAVLPPLVSRGAHISLRVPSRTSWSLDELVTAGLCDVDVAHLLRAVVQRRLAFMISGGTGSGKTTLLAAMLREADAGERVLLIEDVRELRVEHPHVVSLEARAANVEGHGAIPLATLVRQAVRMRPDRLVVGEVRGAEVRELLTALNTGHEGGCGTLHANSPQDVIARFEALGALAELTPAAVRSQLRSAIDLIVHVRRTAGARVVSEIALLDGRDEALQVQTALRRDGDRLVPGPGHPQLLRLLGITP